MKDAGEPEHNGEDQRRAPQSSSAATPESLEETVNARLRRENGRLLSNGNSSVFGKTVVRGYPEKRPS